MSRSVTGGAAVVCRSCQTLCGEKVITEHERIYIVWQNRAFRFYLAARLLLQREQEAPAAFCAVQAIELLLKATLVYWDKSFDLEAARHRVVRMVRSVRNKVPGAKEFDLPQYFHFEQRYYSASRYPSNGKGILVPASILSDLDLAFSQLAEFVPFQFNSELSRALSGRHKPDLAILRRGNSSIQRLRKHLRIKSTSSHSKRLKRTLGSFGGLRTGSVASAA
jgi:HEPN domain-containing protein